MDRSHLGIVSGFVNKSDPVKETTWKREVGGQHGGDVAKKGTCLFHPSAPTPKTDSH